jgi:hypothetical protein
VDGHSRTIMEIGPQKAAENRHLGWSETGVRKPVD